MMRALFLAALVAVGCDSRAPLGDALRYLDEPSFRRDALLRSITNPDNSYSRQRLDSYALGDRGWDTLPVWIPQTRPLSIEDQETLRTEGQAGLAARGAPPPIWDSTRPSSDEAWIALGREVFFGYPLRAEPLAEFALARPALAERMGLEHTDGGDFPGLRVIIDTDGQTRVGITCALCHTSVEADGLVVGRARRRFDFGGLRVAFHEETGAPIDPVLLAQMRRWGPGRADVTEDDEDPVAIPDLWGVAAQTALNQAGTLRQAEGSPVALAIRQETQLLTANRQRVRPPRELALALALYVRSLAPPARPRAPASDEVSVGRALFSSLCRGCHSNEAFGGPPVELAQLGTDPQLANGRARGTGRYRPPALLDVAFAAPYLHHGAVPSLEALLSPARLAASYTESPLGPGPVPGHLYGTELTDPDRRALVAFLNRL